MAEPTDAGLQLYVDIASITSSLVAVCVAIIVVLQFVALKKSIQSSTYQSIAQSFNDLSKIFIDSPWIADVIFGESLPEAASLDREKLSRIDWVVAQRFVWFESIVIQRDELPRGIFDHWMTVLRREISRAVMRKHWDDNKKWYHRSLDEEIGRILGSGGSRTAE